MTEEEEKEEEEGEEVKEKEEEEEEEENVDVNGGLSMVASYLKDIYCTDSLTLTCSERKDSWVILQLASMQTHTIITAQVTDKKPILCKHPDQLTQGLL